MYLEKTGVLPPPLLAPVPPPKQVIRWRQLGHNTEGSLPRSSWSEMNNPTSLADGTALY